MNVTREELLCVSGRTSPAEPRHPPGTTDSARNFSPPAATSGVWPSPRLESDHKLSHQCAQNYRSLEPRRQKTNCMPQTKPSFSEWISAPAAEPANAPSKARRSMRLPFRKLLPTLRRQIDWDAARDWPGCPQSRKTYTSENR